MFNRPELHLEPSRFLTKANMSNLNSYLPPPFPKSPPPQAFCNLTSPVSVRCSNDGHYTRILQPPIQSSNPTEYLQHLGLALYNFSLRKPA